MSGGGIGAALGTGAGILLAPETGGLSLAIPALAGAAGGAIGSAITGGNVMQSAMLGGMGGLLGGALGPGTDQTNFADIFGNSVGQDAESVISPGSGAAGSTIGNAASASASPTLDAAAGLSSQSPTLDAAANLASQAAPDATTSPILNAASQAGQPVSPLQTATQTPTPPVSGGVLNSLSKNFNKNPLPYVGMGLGVLGAMNPAQGNKIDQSQLLANQKQMNPGFYANLPKYNYTTNYTAPQGSWYTYGQRPQQNMYNSTLTPAKHGGLMRGYAQGGRVLGLAIGGMPSSPMAPQGASPMPSPIAPPPQQPPMGAMPPQQPGQPPSPLAALGGQQQPGKAAHPLMQAQAAQAAQQAHKLGQAIRQHIIKQAMHTGEGSVKGQGDGQSDSVPAKLSNNEYVLPADVVSTLGSGSSDAGAKQLDNMVHNVRTHRVSHGAGFPPKAKSPLSYIKKAA